MSGLLLFVVMVLTIVSGLQWSTYWGQNFSALANRISPNSWTDTPASPLGKRGDLDRLGNQIHWNTGDQPIPASYAPPADGTAPAPLSLDSVVAIGTKEGMKPGYTVNFPTNTKDEATGQTIYGSFTLSNSWPRPTGEAKDVYLNQFTGANLAQNTGWGLGKVSYAMDTLVENHMGVQLGLFSRIMMTAVSVLAIWSAISASVMYLKRRRKGSLGLPRRPVDVRLARGVGVIVIVAAVMFPTWGVSAILVLAIDRFVIRRTSLRTVFGQR
jgi:uncharacterized iron-regulated membrane protein